MTQYVPKFITCLMLTVIAAGSLACARRTSQLPAMESQSETRQDCELVERWEAQWGNELTLSRTYPQRLCELKTSDGFTVGAYYVEEFWSGSRSETHCTRRLYFLRDHALWAKYNWYGLTPMEPICHDNHLLLKDSVNNTGRLSLAAGRIEADSPLESIGIIIYIDADDRSKQ